MSNKYRFKEHVDASFYGIGPWKIEEVLHNGYLKMVPVDDGFSYSPYVYTNPLHFHESFEKW